MLSVGYTGSQRGRGDQRIGGPRCILLSDLIILFFDVPHSYFFENVTDIDILICMRGFLTWGILSAELTRELDILPDLAHNVLIAGVEHIVLFIYLHEVHESVTDGDEERDYPYRPIDSDADVCRFCSNVSIHILCR